MKEAGCEILPHPADIGIRAWGVDLCEALSLTVNGLATIALGRPPEPGGDERPFELEAESEEELVVILLEECLYWMDAEGWLPRSATLDRFEAGRARGRLHGALFDPEVEDAALHIKAITWHQLSVRHGPDGVEVVVFLDI